MALQWEKIENGWYVLKAGKHVAAVCQDLVNDKIKWCAYIQEDMPPGDAQFSTLKEAKKWVEQAISF